MTTTSPVLKCPTCGRLNLGIRIAPGDAIHCIGCSRSLYGAKAGDQDWLGREVRAAWIAWAEQQPNPKPSWLQSWEELTEPEREVDRQIGERLWRVMLGKPALTTTGAATGREEGP